MKTSEEWITQAVVDKEADKLLREYGTDIEKVTGNQLATRLGMVRGNQSVYDKFKDWKERRTAEGALHVSHAPQGLRESLEARVSALASEIVTAALGLTGKALAEERRESDRDMAALRRSRVEADEEKADLMVQLDASRAREASLMERLKAADAEAADLRAALAYGRAREEEVRQVNAALIARIGQPGVTRNTEPPSQTCLGQSNGAVTKPVEIDISRYDMVPDEDDA